MVLDFKEFDIRKRPVLVLRNMDCVPFGALCTVFNVTSSLRYNETCELIFDVPASDNGVPTPFYDEIKAMNIIEWKGIGQFILKSAEVISNGIRVVKHCKAYSLEFEMTYKQFFAEKGTYNFWNPVSPKGTIIGMILETMPYWSVGSIDASLIGKYRTFECSNENVYNFIKNTAQNTYGCIFTFDTYARKINVIDVKSVIPTAQIYLSTKNLIKEITITEDTDDIWTCMEAYGADDVSIRSVNPLGTNKIYKLNHFMTETNVSKDIIEKWAHWEKLFDNYQLPYYNLKVEESIQSARLLTEKAALTDMNGELKKLEGLQSVCVQYLGEHPHDAGQQAELDKINAQIAEQKGKIEQQKALLLTVQADIDAVAAEAKAINDELAFSNTFTADEILSFSKYIKESSIQDSSFVVSTVKNYNSADTSSKHQNVQFDVSNSVVTCIANRKNKELYSVVGGTLTCPCGETLLTADIVRCSMERKADGAFVLSAYLNKGKVGDVSFPSGNISVTGTAGAVSTDVIPDPDVPDAFENGTRLAFTASEARVYFTQNATEYEARAVQFDLYEYAKRCLNGASVPHYTFSVDVANFLHLEEFELFKDHFMLGQRVYLEVDRKKVLRPMVIGVNISTEAPGNFSLAFSDKFTSIEPNFGLADMFKESVSMGSKYNRDQFLNKAFTDSGAAGTIDSYIRNALDVSKQEILATVGQAFTLDENGFRMRKWLADRSGYEPEQIWMNNNTINFTADNWNTVKTALGRVNVGGSTLYGLVAEVIVGHSILGKNFSISSEKEHGGIQEFRIDGAGVRIYNGAFYLSTDGGGQIVLTAADGILLGTVGLFTFDENGVATVDKTKANMWLDMNGIIHLIGVQAENGNFSGDVIAKNLYFLDGTDVKTLLSQAEKKFDLSDMDYIDLGGIQLDGPAGDISMTGNINMGGSIKLKGNIDLSEASKILFGKNTVVKVKYSTNKNAAIPGGWSDTWNSSWSASTSTEVWAIYSYNGGETWEGPQLAQGKSGADGKPGANGSNANVDYASIKAALQKAASTQTTFITADEVGAPNIYGGNIYGANIYAGDGSGSFAQMDGDGFNVYVNGVDRPKIRLESLNGGSIINLVLGAGTQSVWQNTMQFVKSDVYAAILYHTSSGGMCGFEFNNDGSIDVQGKLNATFVLA